MSELQLRVLMLLYLEKEYVPVIWLCEREGVGIIRMREVLQELLDRNYVCTYDDLWRIAHRGRALFDGIRRQLNESGI